MNVHELLQNKTPLQEIEVVNIIEKIAQAIKQMHGLGIMHRDVFQNVMIEFKQLGPTEADIMTPVNYYQNARKQRIPEMLKNLKDPSSFNIKIIDYGITRLDDKGADADKEVDVT